MGINTDLSQSPYWNGFNANNQYYHILQKPSTPVQTRELNETQSMLLNQINSFGDNIFVGGTIVKGCNITKDSNISFVKLVDTFANGAALTTSNFLGTTAVSSNSGITAFVKQTTQGYIATAPNLNTIFVKYLNSSTSNVLIKTFQPNETVSFYNSANVLIGQANVANDSISGGNTSGFSYLLGVDDGIVYQNGMFLNVTNQSIIVTPYSNKPDGISVGFSSFESVVTAYQDPSLNDNSQGSPNNLAPGADRLKIVPTLTIAQTNTVYSNNFFSIVDFVDGAPSYINQDTQYATIGKKMSQISDDTNGSFVIKNFPVSTTQAFFANGSVDPNNMKLTVSSGLGYITGARVNLLGKIETTIAKGNAVGQANVDIITAEMGNYIAVKDVGGYFDPTILQTIYLCAANGYAVSNSVANGISVNSRAAPGGSVLGTATLIGVEPLGGNLNTANASFNMYLTNIRMTGTNQFTSVRSLYSNTGGTSVGIADIIQANSSTYSILQSPASAPLIYSLGSSAVDTLKNSSNAIDTQFQYTVSTPVSFSTAGLATVTVPSHVGGADVLPYGTGLISGALENQFTVVCEANVASANMAGTVTTGGVGTYTVTGSGTNFNNLYTGAMIVISNSTVSEVKQVNSISSATSLTLVNPLLNSWASASNLAIYYLAGTILPVSSSPIAINVINPTSFSINLNTTLNTTMAANVSYNVQRTSAAPRQKNLQTDVWVKIDCSNNAGGTTGPWCLGIPDVYMIKNVYVGTTYATTNPTSTNWILQNGQDDTFYGLGWLYNNGMTLTTANKLFVQLQCFVPDVSHGISFFSIDSYNIDDAGLTANSIYTRDIPMYNSVGASTTYNLRNSLDFRFYSANTIPLVGSAGAVANLAIINPSSVNTLINTNVFLPTVDSKIQTSFQYYMGRYDTVGLSNTGAIISLTGTPSVSPRPTGLVSGGMTLAYVYIPPYPSVTPDVIDAGMISTYPTTAVTYHTNKRYTMADIGNLDQRLQTVEYYTSLSLLEQSTQNLMLTNSNGATRFQNGMIADPMDDFSIANTADPAFNIAIDSQSSVARPVFTQFINNLMFVPSQSTNVVLSNDGKLVSFPYTSQRPLIQQMFASKERNCAQDVTYVWNGTVNLSPTGDYYPDVTVGPTVVANQDLYSNFVNLVNAWNTQYSTWTETGTSSTSSTSSSTQILTNPFFHGFDARTTTTNNSSTTTNFSKNQMGISESTSTYDLGSYVTSVSILPWCRPNLLYFSAYGLKPNTQVWVYIDKVSMTPTYTMQTNSSWAVTSTTSLVTDANGVIYGFVFLPPNTFHTGTLTLEILDISNLATQSDLITTQASCFYYGTNVSYTQNDITLQTESPQFSTYTLNNSVTTYATSSTTSNMYVDPVGQTFQILATALPSGVQGVYVTSLDLFFGAKDANLGISVHIEKLENGYPTGEIVPNSIVHYTSAQVNVSQNASLTTNFAFSAPVFLETGNYCYIVIPDGSNPNYHIWTAELSTTSGNSNKDVTTGATIYALSAGGCLIMSSQAVTWTAYSNESIKYNLYFSSFTATTGTAVFTNDNAEFCNVNGILGQFNIGDLVTFSKASSKIAGTANVQSSTNTVYVSTTAGLVPTTWLAISSNNHTTSLVTQVSSVINSIAFSVTNRPSFTDNVTAGVYVLPGINGNVRAGSNSSFIIATNSTATTSNYIDKSSNYLVFDWISGAFANVTSLVDLPYDTIMPKFSTSVPSVCSLSISGVGTSNNNVIDSNYTNFTFGNDTDFYDYQRVVMSRSNECAFLSGNKSLKISGAMTSGSSYASPAFNMEKAGTVLIHNVINAEYGANTIFLSEVNNVGLATNKYISTTVTLATNLYAEDLLVYIGAYYPPNTEIYVYAKVQNQYDSDSFYNKLWTPMYTTNTYRSSKINTSDTNEFIFKFPTVAPSSVGTAYLDPNNNNVLTYTTPDTHTYTTYNTFAIKIVLLADSDVVVPLISDVRAIALT